MNRLTSSHAAVLSKQIESHGLSAFQKPIVDGAFTAFWLNGRSQVLSEEHATSRFAGNPDLPQDFDATAELNGLIFIYQINLDNLPHCREVGLPDSGLLSVFSNAEADCGKAYYFEADSKWSRYQMPGANPEYIFAKMRPYTLEITTGIELPGYGDDLLFELEDAGKEAEYESLIDSVGSQSKYFGKILGRQSDLEFDMCAEAAESCGGKPEDWRSLWTIFSNQESGLIISDYHSLHGLIRSQDLEVLGFSNLFSTSSVV